jgi:hypothetical protein
MGLSDSLGQDGFQSLQNFLKTDVNGGANSTPLNSETNIGSKISDSNNNNIIGSLLGAPVPSQNDTVAPEPTVTNNTVSLTGTEGVVYGLPETFSSQLLDTDYAIDLSKNYPIAEFTPGKMQYNDSHNIVNAWDFVPQVSKFMANVNKVLSDAGASPSYMGQSPFKFACVDFQASEALNNNYSESSLQGVNDIASNLVKDYSYLANGNFDTFKDMISQNIDGISPDLRKQLSGLYSSTLGKFEGSARNISSTSTIGQIMSGYRVDLPKVWKNSQSDKIYTLRIQLVCQVDNPQELIDRILTPYTMLLALSSPRANPSYLYKWPFLVEFKIPGIVHIPLGAITSVQVNKPGHNLFFSNNNKMLSINLSVTVAPLYSTQLLVENGSLPKSMMTVNDEIKTIAEGFLQN